MDFLEIGNYLERLNRHISIPSRDYRVNVGIRTFHDVLLSTIVTKADHSMPPHGQQLLVKANTFMLVDVQQLTDLPLEQGDQVLIYAQTSDPVDPAIVFYTLTDNRTNDPSISVPASMFRPDVSQFFIY